MKLTTKYKKMENKKNNVNYYREKYQVIISLLIMGTLLSQSSAG